MYLIDSNVFIYLKKAKTLNIISGLSFCYCNCIKQETGFIFDIFPTKLISCVPFQNADDCILEQCKMHNFILITNDKKLKSLATKNLIQVKTLSKNKEFI